jgi:hypothetical protein
MQGHTDFRSAEPLENRDDCLGLLAVVKVVGREQSVVGASESSTVRAS